MSDGVFIQFVCQFFNLMVVQIKVCQRFVPKGNEGNQLYYL
jgi:hypothetical protein